MRNMWHVKIKVSAYSERNHVINLFLSTSVPAFCWLTLKCSLQGSTDNKVEQIHSFIISSPLSVSEYRFTRYLSPAIEFKVLKVRLFLQESRSGGGVLIKRRTKQYRLNITLW